MLSDANKKKKPQLKNEIKIASSCIRNKPSTPFFFFNLYIKK